MEQHTKTHTRKQSDNVLSTQLSVLTLPTFHALRLHIHYFSNNTTVKGNFSFILKAKRSTFVCIATFTHPISFARINQNTNSTLTWNRRKWISHCFLNWNYGLHGWCKMTPSYSAVVGYCREEWYMYESAGIWLGWLCFCLV